MKRLVAHLKEMVVCLMKDYFRILHVDISNLIAVKYSTFHTFSTFGKMIMIHIKVELITGMQSKTIKVL